MDLKEGIVDTLIYERREGEMTKKGSLMTNFYRYTYRAYIVYYSLVNFEKRKEILRSRRWHGMSEKRRQHRHSTYVDQDRA